MKLIMHEDPGPVPPDIGTDDPDVGKSDLGWGKPAQPPVESDKKG